MSKTLREWAKEAYNTTKNNGFHEGEGDPKEKISSYLMNIHGEISELWESYRNNKLDDLCDKADKMKEHGIVPLTNLEEELADVILRAFDMSAAFGVDIEKAVGAKNEYNKTRAYRHGGKLN